MTLKDVLKILKTSNDNINNSQELFHGFCSLPMTDKKKVIAKINILNSQSLVNFLNHFEVLDLMTLSEINSLLLKVEDKDLLLLVFRPIFYQMIIKLANKLEPNVAICYLMEIYRNNKNLDAFLKLNYAISYLNINILMALAINGKSKNIIQLIGSKDTSELNYNYIFNILASIIDRTIDEKNRIDYAKREYVLFVLKTICKKDTVNVYHFLSQINDSELIIMILNHYEIPLNFITPKLTKKVINNLRFLSDLKGINFDTLKSLMSNLTYEEIFDYITQVKFINVVGNKNIIGLLKLLPKDYYEEYVETIVDNSLFDEVLFNECFKYLSPEAKIRFLSYEKVILNLDVSAIINYLTKFNDNERSRIIKLILNASHNCLDKQMIILFEYSKQFNTSIDAIYKDIIIHQEEYPKELQLSELIQIINRKYENKIINATDDGNYRYLIGYLGKKNVNGEGLFFKLLSKSYCDKEISKSYYQIVVLRILYYLIANNLLSNTKGSYSLLKKEDTGISSYDVNGFQIELNLQNVESTFRTNLPLFEACFHEVCHCHRQENITAGQTDFPNLIMSLEESLEKYDGVSQTNNWPCGEVEAFSESIHKLYQLLSSYNEELAAHYLNQSAGILTAVKNKLNKKGGSIHSYNELESKFERLVRDNILNKELIQRIFNEYPVIRYLYNFNLDGSIMLKSIMDIIEAIVTTKDNKIKELYSQIFESRLKQINNIKDKKILNKYYREIARLATNQSEDPDFNILRQRVIGIFNHNETNVDIGPTEFAI